MQAETDSPALAYATSIDLHPSFRLIGFFAEGFSRKSDMRRAYDQLLDVHWELDKIVDGSHLLTSAKSLGERLIKAFDQLKSIDRQFDRKQMIESFDNPEHEIGLS
jgi:hypothetical protein